MVVKIDTVYSIDCEYDIGQDLKVFRDHEDLYGWAEEALKSSGASETVQELEDEGLFVINEVGVYG